MKSKRREEFFYHENEQDDDDDDEDGVGVVKSLSLFKMMKKEKGRKIYKKRYVHFCSSYPIRKVKKSQIDERKMSNHDDDDDKDEDAEEMI